MLNLRVKFVLFTVIFSFLGILACNLPIGGSDDVIIEPYGGEDAQQPTPIVEEPAPAEDEPAAAEPDVSFEGVSFSYDDSLASGVDTTIESAFAVQLPGDWDGSLPDVVQFTLEGYPASDVTFHEPRIEVYPSSGWSADIAPIGEGVLTELEAVLASQSPEPPPPSNYNNGGFPMFPVFNAAQLFATHVEYADFQSGQGMRFVTQYSQAVTTVNNLEVFYTYQGITADGEHFVSVIMPVSHPLFREAPDDFPDGDIDTFMADTEYLNRMVEELRNQPPDSFTPSLTLLDEMVQSITVER